MGYGPSQNGNDGQAVQGERGYRRKKLAAMAGNLYRSGAQAVTEIKEQYNQQRAAGLESEGRPHIPGAFPDVAIVTQGEEQMVLFPSYAKRHVKKDWEHLAQKYTEAQQNNAREEADYWRQEWERNEDEKAIVDVDVRGWLYSPSAGPLTRRNRMLLGLARQLSGIAAPKAESQSYDGSATPPRTQHQMHEAMREQQRIEQEAAQIERRGQKEKQVAYQGGFSEKPQQTTDPETGIVHSYQTRRDSQASSMPPSPTQAPSQYSTTSATGNDLTEAELAVANTNLMARIAPFMTTPMVSLPMTIFFYNETKSQSRTVMTNEAGHFIIRAALDFIPTHVRVLANEQLSTIQEVKITEPTGVSLISDVDDTIKRSNISGGAREIFRNTFIRDLKDLTVDGVPEWYNQMHSLGVSIHYCSNSPWQLYPVLASYLKIMGFPTGSLHLKQYTGMLQGIFEPVAERKKTTLDRLLRDFPERKFILVGDSGEADLEVYTELALQNPGRVLAVFIRDVTTPEKTEFFDSAFNIAQRKASSRSLRDGYNTGANTVRPKTAGAGAGTGTGSSGLGIRKMPSKPAMGTLIDFSGDTEDVKLENSSGMDQIRNASKNSKTSSATDLLAGKKPPPPRPSKPVALRSASSLVETEKAPSLPARKPIGTGSHPLSQTQNSSQQTSQSNRSSDSSSTARPRTAGAGSTPRAMSDRVPPPPPPPRRRGTPLNTQRESSANADIDYDPLPAPTAPPQAMTWSNRSTRSPRTSPTSSPPLGAQQQLVNRKVELWNRRLARAHEQLHGLGIALHTWRRGQDVFNEAISIVNQAQKEMGNRNRGHG